MILEFVSKKAVIQETRENIEVSILDKVTFVHYKYSGGYDYFVKFVPSISTPIADKKISTLDFIYMDDDKVIKEQIKINPFDRFPEVRYISDKKEFEYVGTKKRLSQDYLTIIINYWLLQKRCDNCFFNKITEEQFNEEKEKFFSQFY